MLGEPPAHLRRTLRAGAPSSRPRVAGRNELSPGDRSDGARLLDARHGGPQRGDPSRVTSATESIAVAVERSGIPRSRGRHVPRPPTTLGGT
jgi:hypothetical protein